MTIYTFQAVLISPLFFGVAHLHHMIERIRKGIGTFCIYEEESYLCNYSRTI